MEDLFIVFTKNALSGKGNQDIAWTAIISLCDVNYSLFKLSFSVYWIALLKRRKAMISTIIIYVWETTAWKWVCKETQLKKFQAKMGLEPIFWHCAIDCSTIRALNIWELGRCKLNFVLHTEWVRASILYTYVMWNVMSCKIRNG